MPIDQRRRLTSARETAISSSDCRAEAATDERARETADGGAGAARRFRRGLSRDCGAGDVSGPATTVLDDGLHAVASAESESTTESPRGLARARARTVTKISPRRDWDVEALAAIVMTAATIYYARSRARAHTRAHTQTHAHASRSLGSGHSASRDTRLRAALGVAGRRPEMGVQDTLTSRARRLYILVCLRIFWFICRGGRQCVTGVQDTQTSRRWGVSLL